MAGPLPNAILDKIDACPLGMHSGIPPHLLKSMQCAFMVNGTFRGGHPKTRPAIRKLNLTYESEQTQTRATQAIFQTAKGYDAIKNNPNCILSSIGGRIFRYLINGNNVSVAELGFGDQNNPTLNQAWMYQGEEFMVIQDGESKPLIFDGATLRKANDNEVPVGCMGAYVNGRLITVLPNRISYVAGDLVYSTASGTPTYDYRDSILKMTENQQILGGRAFGVPANAGRINSVFSVAASDTIFGQGPLQIGTRKGAFTVTLPLDATLWTTTLQPQQVAGLPSDGNEGPASQDSVVRINGDAWYRAGDGIRSYMLARRDFSNTWVQTSLSFEMTRVISKDTDFLLGYSSSVNFNQRFITTCSPYRSTDRGIAHRGLIALDFNNISSLTVRDVPPAYDGLWTGLPILKILTAEFGGQERCFIFGLDADNNIALYELLKDSVEGSPSFYFFDFDGTDDVLIESSFESFALFGRDELSDQEKIPLKRFITADVFLENMLGNNGSFTVNYRSDGDPLWHEWKTFEWCAPPTDCPEDCVQPSQVFPQYRTFIRLPDVPDECNAASGRYSRTGYYHQVQLQWSGYLEVHQMLCWANFITESLPGCPGEPTCTVLKGCVESDFTYSIES